MNADTVQALRHAAMAIEDIAKDVTDDQRIRLKSCAAIINLAVTEEESNAAS